MSLSVRLFGDRNRAQELVGEAKRQLALLKRSMVFQGLSQLTLPAKRLFDGSTIMVKSIFGIDIMEIVGAGVLPLEHIAGVGKKLLIFLLHSNNSYAVWEIMMDEDEPDVLKLSKFNISRHVQYIEYYLPALHSFPKAPSVTQSSRNFSTHVVSIQNLFGYDCSGIISKAIYGRQVRFPSGPDDLICYVFYGMTSDFEPVGYNINDREYFEGSGIYAASDYIAGSRHTYQIYNEKVIKDLTIWLVDDTDVKIRYRDEDGEKYGVTLNAYDVGVFAALTPELAVYKDKTIIDLGSGGNTIVTILFVYVETRWQIDPEDAVCKKLVTRIEDYRDYTDIDSITGWGPEYFFGTQVLEGLGNSSGVTDTYKKHYKGDLIYYQVDDWRIYGCISPSRLYYWVTDTIRQYYYRTIDKDQTLSPIDYDNMDGEETCIFFYYVFSGDGSSSSEWDILVYKYSPPIGPWYYVSGYLGSWSETWTGGSKMECKMMYRINGGSFETEKISTIRDGNFKRIVNGDTIFDITGFQGERIFRPTCKVTDEYLIYSYIIQTYTGNLAESHWNGYIETDWDFKKRILGVINIKTGKRTEHEVNDELLGDLYKDTFNKTEAAAIGLHKL